MESNERDTEQRDLWRGDLWRGERQKRGRVQLQERECGEKKRDIEQNFQRKSTTFQKACTHPRKSVMKNLHTFTRAFVLACM